MPKDKKKRISAAGDVTLDSPEKFSVTIADAIGQTRHEPLLTEEEPTRRNAPPDLGSFLASISQATLHRESSGRGGRVVTVVGIKPAPEEAVAQALAKSMRKNLGCGSHVEDCKVILQGDIQKRAQVWLLKCGVRKIVIGN